MAKKIDEFGGSCITPKIHKKRRDTDYDGYDADMVMMSKRLKQKQ